MKRTATLAALALAGLAGCTEEPETETGAVLYGEYCAECHGPGAQGGLEIGGRRTPDLTTLARRHGGVFPTAYAMSTIDGYARAATHGPMPSFGDLIDSPMEVWTDPDGTPTPTPAALLRLAEYLEGLQG